MQGTLLLAILNIRSSYSQNVERRAGRDEPPDTLQWWIGGDAVWRIRTFAVDHDIHTYRAEVVPDILEIAAENNLKHYGNIIESQYHLEFADCNDRADVENVFAKTGLQPNLEVAGDRFAFWNPDQARYRTQTVPRQIMDSGQAGSEE